MGLGKLNNITTTGPRNLMITRTNDTLSKPIELLCPKKSLEYLLLLVLSVDVSACGEIETQT